MINFFADLPTQLPEELIQTLVTAQDVRIERILSQGHVSPEHFWYDQEMHEWVLLLRGAARLMFAERTELEMKPGDFVLIPAHQRHRVVWTDPTQVTVWLAVHYR